MRTNGIDYIFSGPDEAPRAEYDKLMALLLDIESEVSACHSAINEIGDKIRPTPEEKKAVADFSHKIAELESTRTYFEFSLFMDYSMKRAFENDDSHDGQRLELIKSIKDRNPFYLKP